MPNLNLLLQSEEIDTFQKAALAMDAIRQVPGILSVGTHTGANALFIVYERPAAEGQLKRALEEAGFPLLS